ncbi:MAG TPA: CAP domain-containing protein [Paracoccus sp. (in: a-proteobacteria)]|uniref:CAP domain-containing protein n=1 Tax=Paracoccus sp. TaxID=267 RepID=UPI002BC265B0|nr:CAP domain-containing protein [Paracoccus sp. (in: a-proteobacteria)]HWL58712.1 CAP domain-containing protein [Paracoccus sp. (in: a-proteobacteria)]
MSFASANERYFASLVNQARRAEGLPALTLERRLNDSSEDHSRWMLTADVFSHTGRGGSSARERMEAAGFTLRGDWMTAENIAYVGITGEADLSDEIRALHQMLMNSPGHHRNIMSDAAYIGIGLEVGLLRVNGQDHRVLMATQNFADTDGPVRIDNGRFGRAVDPEASLTMQTRQHWWQGFDGETYVTPGPRQSTIRNDDYRLTARNDMASGAAGHDWMAGNAGHDTLNGGAGNDRLIGGAGMDLLQGGPGNDTQQGGAGNDRLIGGDGNDQLRGELGADHLAGQTGNDWLIGAAGNDTLNGGTGNDTLRGGAGNDLLVGEAGADVFLFHAGDGQDTIRNYQPGMDRLMLDATLVDGGAIAFMRDHMRQTANGVVIDFGTDGRIVLTGGNLTVAGVADDIFAI